MKIKYHFLLLPLVIGILTSCQPRSIVKSEQKALPDSVLYYQQADIADPFLDTIFQEPDQAIVLNQKIYPPHILVTIPKFKEVEGFRVQVFAGTDSLSARSVRSEITEQTDDSVHYLIEKGLHKIQVGDYLYRYLADNMKTNMRQTGYPGAWVVQRTIIVPVDTTTADSIATRETGTDKPGEVSGKYKIQLVATGSQERAEEIVRQVQANTTYRVFYEQSGNLYKVFVGLFESEPRAREELTKLRDLGYPDAWLVY